MQVIDEDMYTPQVIYDTGSYTFTLGWRLFRFICDFNLWGSLNSLRMVISADERTRVEKWTPQP